MHINVYVLHIHIIIRAICLMFIHYEYCCTHTTIYSQRLAKKEHFIKKMCQPNNGLHLNRWIFWPTSGFFRGCLVILSRYYLQIYDEMC